MRLFVTLILYTFLVENSNSREYHYEKPVTPFYTGQPNYAQTSANYFPPSQGVPQQPQPQSGHANLPAIVRTYGPTARDYVVSGVTNSHQVFEGRQLPPVPPTHVVPPPPANYQHQQQLPPGSAPHTAPPPPNNQVRYHTIAPQGVYLPPPPPPGYQQPGKTAYPRTAQQASYSARVNPFNQFAQGAGVGNYAQAGGTYNSASGQQIAGNYGAPSQQAGGASGNYISQSESGQLDGYAYKQIGGDTRPYKRIINTCYPNGQCERSTLEGGSSTQAGDARHQHFIVSARAHTAPVSDKCQRIAEAKRVSSAYAAPGSNYAAPPVGNSNAGQSARPNYADAAGYTTQNQNSFSPQAANYAAPQTPNYAAPQTPNYAAPQTQNYAAPQTQNYAAPQTPNYAAPPVAGSYNAPAFTGATNTIDGNYGAPDVVGSKGPEGPVRPLARRLFEYAEVVLQQDPFN